LKELDDNEEVNMIITKRNDKTKESDNGKEISIKDIGNQYFFISYHNTKKKKLHKRERIT